MISNSSNKVSLKVFEMRDAYKTFEWVNDENLRNDFLMDKVENIESHLAYFENKLKKDDEKIYKILNEDIHIGNCGYKNIINDCAELWIYIGERLIRGNGFGKKALQELIKIGFNELKFHKIYLHVAAKNSIALNMYKAIGFKEVKSMGSESIFKETVIYMELEK